jgi:predicted AAA+ superfamily ATPase
MHRCRPHVRALSPARGRDLFVDSVFRLDGIVAMPPCSLTKRDYVARALRGGYPEAVRRDPGRRRARFFDSYVTDLVTRDVRQISDIERPAEMRRLLSVMAVRMGDLDRRSVDGERHRPATSIGGLPDCYAG